MGLMSINKRISSTSSKGNLNDIIRRKRYTIKDIAQIAGVTSSTVSLVINNKKGISEKTRLRVISIVEKLDYIPSAIARGLVKNKTYVFGLIIPSISDPFFADLAKGVEDAGFKHGFSLIVCNSDYDSEKERLYVSLMIEQHAAGVIIVPGTIDYSSFDLAFKSNIPVIFADCKVDVEKAGYVTSDNFKGAYDVALHLLKFGHRRIACINTTPDGFTIQERVKGYRQALTDSQVAIDEQLIVKSNNSFEGGQAIAEKLLALHPRPTAIVGNNDLLAIGVLDTLLSRGFSVPDDISVTGFDNIRFSGLARVPLTTVEQPKYEMGVAAFELLLRAISSNDSPRTFKLFDTQLIIRQSTGVCSDEIPNALEARYTES